MARYFFLWLIVLTAPLTYALSLKADYPKRYVVQQGDTLWGIAARYLEKPWEWHALWKPDSGIKNPDTLYPGTVLIVQFRNNTPYLRAVDNQRTVVLSPHVRSMPAQNPVKPLALEDVSPFLDASLVMDANRLRHAPYVVAFKTEHMMAGQGDEIYVKNLRAPCTMPQAGPVAYAIYRKGPPLYSPPRKTCLGYKARLVGRAEWVHGCDPAVVTITSLNDGIKQYDRVMLDDFPGYALSFYPKAPDHPVHGRIIEIAHDARQGAAGYVVLIDRGIDAGLRSGDVLAIYAKKRMVCDKARCHDRQLLLPPERLGELMIFRTFSKTSYALVMRSVRAITLRDSVVNP